MHNFVRVCVFKLPTEWNWRSCFVGQWRSKNGYLDIVVGRCPIFVGLLFIFTRLFSDAVTAGLKWEKVWKISKMLFLYFLLLGLFIVSMEFYWDFLGRASCVLYLEIVYKWMTELVVIVSVVVCLLCCWCVSICTHACFCKQNLRVQLSSGDL